MGITTGSITIKRLRRGYTISLHFVNPTGVALYQGVNSAGGVAPDWSKITEDKLRPQIKPVLEATGGLTVEVLSGSAKWTYVGTELSFNSDGSCATEGYKDKFKMLTDGTYTLVIIGNLASKTNDTNDTLTFSCSARCSGAKEQEISGSIDVVISPIGSSTYTGVVGITGNLVAENDGVTTGELSSTTDHVGVTLSLLYAGDNVNFGYAIVKAGTAPTTVTAAKSKQVTIENAISVDDVDGQTTFLVYFYPEGETDPTKYVDMVGFDVLDTTDPFKIVYGYADETVQQVDENNKVTVVPSVVRMGDGVAVGITNDKWEHKIYRLENNGQSFKEVRTVSTKNVVITTDDTDYKQLDASGNETGLTVQCDVDVIGSVQFDLASTT